MTIQHPAETFLPEDETPFLSSRRQDGWSAANQRLFLEAIAEGHGVQTATYRVGLSAASAYAFRRTAKGAAFALGWRAATLVARDCVADTLMVRALEGQVDTLYRADGTAVTRHRHDNRLAMSLLARLDRQVEQAADADVKAARLVAQEFDAFLDLVGRDEGPARAGLFLARRSGGLSDGEKAHDLAPIYALAAADRLVRTGVATAGEVDVSDLDPAARATWSAEQWQRAEAAGLMALAAPERADPETAPAPQHIQHSRGKDADEGNGEGEGQDALPEEIWWDEQARDWRTSFPPSDDFDGFEERPAGHIDYERELSSDERARIAASGLGHPHYLTDAELDALAAQRDAWFALRAAPEPAPEPFSERQCPEQSSPEQPSPEQSSPEQSGPEQSPPERPWPKFSHLT